VACISRDGRKPASRASTIWLAAQIRMSASQIVAMPCSCVPSTRIVTPLARKSIGATRRDFASEKNGKAIKSWLSRGAMSPGKARNRSSCSRSGTGRCRDGSAGLDMAKATRAQAISAHGCPPNAARRIRDRMCSRSCVRGPGIEVGHGVHDAAAELAELGAAAEHALFLQRARRQAQVVGGFVVGEVTLRLRSGSGRSGGRPQGAGRMV
jgi:hypothetical protein